MEASAARETTRHLRWVLAALPVGASIPDSDEFRRALGALEFVLAAALAGCYPEWDHEGIDAILPATAKKIAAWEAEIVGLCILLSDQTTTPVHVRIRIAPDAEKIAALECRLGERWADGMRREEFGDSATGMRRLLAVADRADGIDWVYTVGTGTDPR